MDTAELDDVDAIDTTSDRWDSALHEAAHVVVAEHYGWTVTAAWIAEDGTGGVNLDGSPETYEDYWERALVSLAAPAIEALVHGGPLVGAEADLDIAVEFLDECGGEWDAAWSATEDVVRECWERIHETAEDLYRHGALEL